MDDPGPSAAYLRTFPATADGPVRPPSPSEPLLAADPDFIAVASTETLYALLNLPSTASDAEIRERYRQLATTFHPDRQRDDTHRRAAHSRFTEIQRAYEVLTDPTKRTVYDLFGEEGLRTSWEVGPRIKTPEEMRAHFQRQAYEKRQMDAEALVKPKGDISVVLDARAAFLPASFFANPESVKHDFMSRLRRARPGQIMMKHSFETAMNRRTQVIWTGQMVSRSGAGGGNVVGTVRHQFSQRCWGEVGTSFLAPRIVTGKGTYTFDENT
jgi:DnaJ family protein C protein 11